MIKNVVISRAPSHAPLPTDTAYAECDIRVNVFDTTKIIAAASPRGVVAGLGVFYSTDGGVSWGQSQLPLSFDPGGPFDPDTFQSDPCVDWSSDGTAWAIAIGVQDDDDQHTLSFIRCFKSSDCGLTWTPDVSHGTVSGDQMRADKPMMWIDRSLAGITPAPRDYIYVIWHCFDSLTAQNHSKVFAARRTSGPGGTWGTPIQVSGAETVGLGIGGDITTNSYGDVFAFWPSTGPVVLPFTGSPQLFVAKCPGDSPNFTFNSPVRIADTFGSFEIRIPAVRRRDVLIYISGAAHRTSTTNCVYAAWTDLSGDPSCRHPAEAPGSFLFPKCKSRIWFSRSTDGGTTWETAYQVNPQANRSDQFMPKLVVDETNGHLVIMYSDTIRDPTRKKSDVFMQTSVDNGKSWSAATLITSSPTDETNICGIGQLDDCSNIKQYGEYNGLSGHAGIFYPCWTDRRNKLREEIWTAIVDTGTLIAATAARSSLRLFVKPPYSAWTLEHPYGPEELPLPEEPVKHDDTTLSTTDTGYVYAAIAGELTIRFPGSLLGDPVVSLPNAPTVPVPAIAVTLYLHPSPQSEEFLAATKSLGNLSGFAYTNVDLPSLVLALAPFVEDGLLTIGDGQARSADQIALEFLYGLRPIPVTAGQLIGAASTQGTPIGRRVGFAVLTDTGPIDPSYFYQQLRDYVADGDEAVDQYLALSPVSPLVPVAGVLPPPFVASDLLTTRSLYSMAVLDAFRPENDPSVSPSMWRAIGNRQKELWQRRLRARTGHPLAAETAIAFEFDMFDALNLFQLEALVEFYANFPDPWASGAAPVNPGETGYRVVDFIDPADTDASAAGVVVTLNPTADQNAASITAILNETVKYANVEAGALKIYDLLVLDADTNPSRPEHTYRIVSIDAANGQLSLDSAPVLSGSSPWRIRRRPVIAVVDCFGGRAALRLGQSATVDAGAPAGDVVALDGSPSLARLNPRVDTVYLPDNDDAQRGSDTYRIEEVVDGVTGKIRLDGTPMLTGGSTNSSSRWHIPAGVSGALAGTNEQRAVKSSGAPGFDNYDGALFIVYDGGVQGPFPWTSFTSWESLTQTTGHPGASIRGNADYVVNSFRSTQDPGKAFRNFCFRVTDRDLLYVPGADSVHESRFYFRPHPADPVTDNPAGQTSIRLHAGQLSGSTAVPGSGSRGCLVSVQFGAMRGSLIAVYKEEYRQSHNAEDTRFDDLELKVSTAQSQAYYLSGSLSTGWDNAIVGRLWLIRPDERPLG